MKLEKVNGVKAVTAAKELAKIGHDACSETFVPASFFDIDNGLTYIDCPGFEDDRGIYHEIAANLATLHTARQSTISGVVVFISYPSIELQNGTLLKGLIKILHQMFSSPKSIGRSLVFAFNKVPSIIDLEDIIDQIRYLEETSINLNHKEKEILSLINTTNSMIINPLDQGDSKHSLKEMLSNTEYLYTPDLNLALSNSSKIKLDKFVENTISKGITQLRSFFKLQDILKKKTAHREKQQKTEKYCSKNLHQEKKKLIDKFNKTNKQTKSLAESRTTKKNDISRLQGQIKDIEISIAVKEDRLKTEGPDDIVNEWSEVVYNDNLFGAKKKTLYPKRNQKNSWISLKYDSKYGSVKSIDRYYSSSYGKIEVKLKASTGHMTFYTTNYKRYVKGFEWIEEYEASIKNMKAEVSAKKLNLAQKQDEIDSINDTLGQIPDKSLAEELDDLDQELANCRQETQFAIQEEKSKLVELKRKRKELDSKENQAAFELMEILARLNYTPKNLKEFLTLKRDYSKLSQSNF